MRVLNLLIKLLQSQNVNFTVGTIHGEEIIIRIPISEIESEQLQHNIWSNHTKVSEK